MKHYNCPGANCARCERAIERIEYEREHGYADLPHDYDGT